MATAVGHLAGLSNTAPLPAGDPQALAAAYAAEGWQADWCALAALNATLPSRNLGALSTAAEDRAAVTAALRALYLPRLQREAALLQDLLRAGVPQSQPRGEVDTLLFVDGLRMDLAQQLAVLLRNSGASVDVDWRWAGFPTVTATCKPLATPAAGRFRGGAADGYAPMTADGKTVGQAELLRELAAAGWQSGKSLLPGEKCWVETGHVDHDGHKLQERLADQLPAMLQDIAACARRLALAGRRVRIVTDHGWLLMPGGLPVAKLGAGLTESKWSRCAIVKDGSAAAAQQLPWTWNASVMVATAPGAHVFWQNEYAHGGISPQECVVPELVVAPMQPARKAVIVQLEWVGCACGSAPMAATACWRTCASAQRAKASRSAASRVPSMRKGARPWSLPTIRSKDRLPCWCYATQAAHWW